MITKEYEAIVRTDFYTSSDGSHDYYLVVDLSTVQVSEDEYENGDRVRVKITIEKIK
jgi:hypothetical protein